MATNYERRPETYPTRPESRMVGDVRYRTTERISEREPTDQDVQETARVLTGTFTAETVAGAGAVVLTILGLAGVDPVAMMLSIAVILIGAGLVIKGAGVASRYRQLSLQTGGGAMAYTQLGAGLSVDIIAGAAGVALGVLGLLGVEPLILTAVALIVFGGALLFTAGETYRVNLLPQALSHHEESRQHAARVSAQSAGGGEALVGIAAIILGILVLTGMEPPMTLVLSGLLAVGAVMLLAGLASGANAAMVMRDRG